MPMPSSRTESTSLRRPSRAGDDRRCPPGSVYLAALVQQVATTCASRAGSATTRSPLPRHVDSRGGAGATRAAGSRSRSPWATTRASSTASRRSSIFPRAMRETSSRSSTRRERCCTCRSMIDRSRSSASGARSCMSCRAVSIGASGLRSSWPSIARNSSLARFASSARRRLGTSLGDVGGHHRDALDAAVSAPSAARRPRGRRPPRLASRAPRHRGPVRRRGERLARDADLLESSIVPCPASSGNASRSGVRGAAGFPPSPRSAGWRTRRAARAR